MKKTENNHLLDITMAEGYGPTPTPTVKEYDHILCDLVNKAFQIQAAGRHSLYRDAIEYIKYTVDVLDTIHDILIKEQGISEAINSYNRLNEPMPDDEVPF